MINNRHIWGESPIKKALIIPGYLAGLGSLLLITYRTILAFFSETKAVTVSINLYGEQHLDIISLVIIWSICLVGLFSLYRAVKDKPYVEPVE